MAQRAGGAELGVQRVVTTTYQGNLASRRVVEKVGMTLVRRLCINSEDILKAHTYQATSLEPWHGDDVEYVLE